MSRAEDYVARVDAVERRLEEHAGREVPGGALTPADPSTGERWQSGQVWAHIAEFVPYWLAEMERVVAGHSEPVPFGRTKSDPERIAAIERDRDTDRAALWHRVVDADSRLRAALAALDERDWQVRGLHPTLGEMDLSRLVEEFLVGHLEQHADQLDALAP